MLNKIKTRIQNPKVITSVVAGVLLVLVNTNLIDVPMSEKVTDVVNTLLGIGITLGIFSDPESHIQK